MWSLTWRMAPLSLLLLTILICSPLKAEARIKGASRVRNDFEDELGVARQSRRTVEKKKKELDSDSEGPTPKPSEKSGTLSPSSSPVLSIVETMQPVVPDEEDANTLPTASPSGLPTTASIVQPTPSDQSGTSSCDTALRGEVFVTSNQQRVPVVMDVTFPDNLGLDEAGEITDTAIKNRLLERLVLPNCAARYLQENVDYNTVLGVDVRNGVYSNQECKGVSDTPDTRCFRRAADVVLYFEEDSEVNSSANQNRTLDVLYDLDETSFHSDLVGVEFIENSRNPVDDDGTNGNASPNVISRSSSKAGRLIPLFWFFALLAALILLVLLFCLCTRRYSRVSRSDANILVKPSTETDETQGAVNRAISATSNDEVVSDSESEFPVNVSYDLTADDMVIEEEDEYSSGDDSFVGPSPLKDEASAQVPGQPMVVVTEASGAFDMPKKTGETPTSFITAPEDTPTSQSQGEQVVTVVPEVSPTPSLGGAGNNFGKSGAAVSPDAAGKEPEKSCSNVDEPTTSDGSFPTGSTPTKEADSSFVRPGLQETELNTSVEPLPASPARGSYVPPSAKSNPDDLKSMYNSIFPDDDDDDDDDAFTNQTNASTSTEHVTNVGVDINDDDDDGTMEV